MQHKIHTLQKQYLKSIAKNKNPVEAMILQSNLSQFLLLSLTVIILYEKCRQQCKNIGTVYIHDPSQDDMLYLRPPLFNNNL